MNCTFILLFVRFFPYSFKAVEQRKSIGCCFLRVSVASTYIHIKYFNVFKKNRRLDCISFYFFVRNKGMKNEANLFIDFIKWISDLNQLRKCAKSGQYYWNRIIRRVYPISNELVWMCVASFRSVQFRSFNVLWNCCALKLDAFGYVWIIIIRLTKIICINSICFFLWCNDKCNKARYITIKKIQQDECA